MSTKLGLSTVISANRSDTFLISVVLESKKRFLFRASARTFVAYAALRGTIVRVFITRYSSIDCRTRLQLFSTFAMVPT